MEFIDFIMGLVMLTICMLLGTATYFLIKEENIRIEQLQKTPEKAIYKNINLEFKGAQNENLFNQR